MATEVLAIPEEHLADVIRVIRAGISETEYTVADEVITHLAEWCNEEEEYLERMGEED